MFCGKAAIVVTEMARNIFLHGRGGEIVIREVATAASTSLELLALALLSQLAAKMHYFSG
jgi:anti-sigma regulatory factor (Ser/Thr protein kinase)